MARPQKQTVDYFPHDSKASDGTTLTILDSHFGNDGYSFWFKLLERLASTPGHFIDCRNPARWQLLLAKTHLGEDTACSILKVLVELDAIDGDLWLKKIIWCQNLVDNIADVYKNRRSLIPQKPSLDGNNPTANVVPTDDNPTADVVSTDESTQTKLKETKLKETKLKETKLKETPPIVPQKSAQSPSNLNINLIYEQNIEKLTPLISKDLEMLGKKYPGLWIRDAIKEAVMQNERRMSYIKGILRNWGKEGHNCGK